MSIAGASQYRYAAILANEQGLSAQSSGLVSDLGTVDLLDLARSTSGSSIGLSSSARQLNKQFLSSTSTNFNAIFSLSVADSATIEGLTAEINALRGDDLPEERVTTGSEGSASFVDDEGNKLSTHAIADLKDQLRAAEASAAEAKRIQERDIAVAEMLAKVRGEVGEVGAIVDTSA